jgi:acyl-CoA thioesterase-1
VILRKTLTALLLALGFITAALAQPAAPKAFTVLFLGDTLTEGLGLETGEAFPELIAARLKAEGRSDIKVINGGVSGSTSASALERLQWYARSKPDLMVLSLGANDGLRGVPVDEMRSNLTKTIEFAQQSGIKVALTGMMIPPNYGPEYTESFARVFPELAEKYQLPFLPFLLEGVAAVPELNQADGIHPNVDGAKIVADHVYRFLADLLPVQ